MGNWLDRQRILVRRGFRGNSLAAVAVRRPSSTSIARSNCWSTTPIQQVVFWRYVTLRVALAMFSYKIITYIEGYIHINTVSFSVMVVTRSIALVSLQIIKTNAHIAFDAFSPRMLYHRYIHMPLQRLRYE